MSTTYSFKDLSGAFTDPDVGAFLFAGQIGMHQATVEMATEKTAQDLAGDGTIMISAIAGENGHVALEMQQTSDLHAFLLAWYNAKITALAAGDVANFAAATVTLRNIVDGSTHVCTGVSPSKIPAKAYAQQGQHITWTMWCAQIINTTL
jgi:hypothetical protein